MAIKKPIVSYFSNDLKDGDFISGKTIQLSEDLNNNLKIGQDGGLISSSQTFVLGKGLLASKELIREWGHMNPNFHVYFPTFKSFTYDHINQIGGDYLICIKGKSYLACETSVIMDRYPFHLIYQPSSPSPFDYYYGTDFLNIPSNSNIYSKPVNIKDPKTSNNSYVKERKDCLKANITLDDKEELCLDIISEFDFCFFFQGISGFDYEKLSFKFDCMLWEGIAYKDWDLYHLYDYEITADRVLK